MNLTIKELNLADKCVRRRVKLLQGWVEACSENTMKYGGPSEKAKLTRTKREIKEMQSLLRSLWNARVEGE